MYMSKSDIEKIDEQIQSLLADKNDSLNSNEHIVFVDRLSTNNLEENEFTKRIEKIDDFEKKVYNDNFNKTNEFDTNKVVHVDEQLDDNSSDIFTIILILILIILALCIILLLLF